MTVAPPHYWFEVRVQTISVTSGTVTPSAVCCAHRISPFFKAAMSFVKEPGSLPAGPDMGLVPHWGVDTVYMLVAIGAA